MHLLNNSNSSYSFTMRLLNHSNSCLRLGVGAREAKRLPHAPAQPRLVIHHLRATSWCWATRLPVSRHQRPSLLGSGCCERREMVLSKEGKSLLDLKRRTVNFRRPGRARNEGPTGPKRLDDTRCTIHQRRTNYASKNVSRRQYVPGNPY